MRSSSGGRPVPAAGRTLRYAALLRGINVGGHKPVAMAELRTVLTAAGLGNVRTLLQSGNVVFESDGKRPDNLERFLEAEVRARLGLAAAFFVRSAAEWKAIVDANPFVDEALKEPARLVLLLLKEAAPADSVARLSASIPGREVLRASGREVYAHYPDGQGTSKLTNAVLERGLGGPVTARNWNTVLRLEEALRPV